MDIAPRRRRDIIDALRRGTVPRQGLDVMAVGLIRFEQAIADELDTVTDGSGVFKAVRGEYGAGKTFFARWLTETAKKRGFAIAEVQVSETETPLHRLETVYRRLVENLATEYAQPSAFKDIVDGWLRGLSQEVRGRAVNPEDASEVDRLADDLLEARLASVSKVAPSFAAALRGYRDAVAEGDRETADGLLAWLAGQPHVAGTIRRRAGLKGELDHFGALGFLQGLLTVLRDSDHTGLVLVLDEVETLQRVRSDVREKSLNALRQLIDEIDSGRFPGLYVLITGTPAFFDGAQGIRRLQPLDDRIRVDFAGDPRFDNPRLPQIRLLGFQPESLLELGTRVRGIYTSGSPASARIESIADDRYLEQLAGSIAGQLGGRAGVAPRLYLRKLVDVMDRIEQFDEYRPSEADARLAPADLSDEEAAASRRGQLPGAAALDAIDLDLDD